VSLRHRSSPTRTTQSARCPRGCVGRLGRAWRSGAEDRCRRRIWRRARPWIRRLGQNGVGCRFTRLSPTATWAGYSRSGNAGTDIPSWGPARQRRTSSPRGHVIAEEGHMDQRSCGSVWIADRCPTGSDTSTTCTTQRRAALTPRSPVPSRESARCRATLD
jgi:hypothetical protein